VRRGEADTPWTGPADLPQTPACSSGEPPQGLQWPGRKVLLTVMVPQTAKELRRKEKPLVLVPRTDEALLEAKSEVAGGQMKVVRLTRKRGGAHTPARTKGQNADGRKGHKGLVKTRLREPEEPKKQSRRQETVAEMASTVTLQERRHQAVWEGREEAVRKKVFLPMVDKRSSISAPVLNTSRVVLPNADNVTEPEPLRRTPVLLTNMWSRRESLERNIPVILTSKEIHNYTEPNEPVNLSMKPANDTEDMTRHNNPAKQANLNKRSPHKEERLESPAIQNGVSPPPAHRQLCFTSPISLESVLTPSESHLSHSVSITKIQRKQNNEVQRIPEAKIEPLNEDSFFMVNIKQEPEEAGIDDDEESYLQKLEGDLSSMVQVKLECNDDLERPEHAGKLTGLSLYLTLS